MADGQIGSNEGGKGPSNTEFYLLVGIVSAVVVVLLALLITLVIQSFTGSQTAFEDLKDQVLIQNQKIDQLTQEFQNCNARRTSGC